MQKEEISGCCVSLLMYVELHSLLGLPGDGAGVLDGPEGPLLDVLFLLVACSPRSADSPESSLSTSLREVVLFLTTVQSEVVVDSGALWPSEVSMAETSPS